MIDRQQLKTIAEQIETVGKWHIAALKIMEAADELDRLTAERDRLRVLVRHAENLLEQSVYDEHDSDSALWVDAYQEWRNEVAGNQPGINPSAGSK